MARKLTAVLLLWVGLKSVGARPWEASPCPGCDCPRQDCFTPGCDCTLAISQGWCEQMLGRIRQRLVGALGPRMEVPGTLRVRLVDPSLLLRYGAGDAVEGIYQDGQITLSSRLTRRKAIVALAHEYGHAWQAHFHPGYEQVDGALREGWAEWVALQALRRFGEGVGGDSLRANRDPVYGGGLRWFLQVERSFGVEAVFEQASTWLDPQGSRLPNQKSKKSHADWSDDDPIVPDDLPEPGGGPSPGP